MIKSNLLWISLVFVNTSFWAQETPVKIEGKTQGTTYHITYFDGQNRNFKKAIDSLFHLFDSSVSTYIPNSLISRVNAGEENIRMDKTFKKCFKTAKKIWKETEGAFDPTVFPLVNAWGFGPQRKDKIEQKKLDSLLQFVGFEKVRLIGNKIKKQDPRVALDFNSFAQGYSVDIIAHFLELKNIKVYLVEIGGEVYAKGIKPNQKKWTIGIEKPFENQDENPLIAVAELNKKALATSGDYRKFTIIDGYKFAHIINPKTGIPVKSNLLSVSVFADDCITADAYATALMVMGLEQSKTFLKSHTSIQVYLIYSDDLGQFHVYETEKINTIIKNITE
ncbi:MAG: FAD:protein FMN transferase [Crocinitomicaceae bacterium]